MTTKKREQKKKKSLPIEFLNHAQSDAKTSAMVQTAIEKGAAITANEVLKIAESNGYKFTREEFEKAVRDSYIERFSEGDISVADVLMQSKRRPPESSCAKGCLSYTKNWHPSFNMETG